MFKLKLAGDRPVISQYGIFYKDGKHDKYIYIQTALEILQDIDQNYDNNPTSSHIVIPHNIAEEDIHRILQSYETNLEEEVLKTEKQYEAKITKEIRDIQNSSSITKIEKETWCENIKIMKEYRIQRAINKIYYFHTINDIKNVILDKKIKEIQTPFNEKFWHVLHSVQGVLENQKYLFKTNLEEEIDYDTSMIIKLNIGY